MDKRLKKPLETASHDKIELRSDKMRKILGEVPNRIVRWGTPIMCVIFAALIAAVLLLKFPYGNGETIFEHIFLM